MYDGKIEIGLMNTLLCVLRRNDDRINNYTIEIKINLFSKNR